MFSYVHVKYMAVTNTGIFTVTVLGVTNPKEMKRIASKLHQGVSVERILDDIHDNIDRNVSREHLVTRQDIRNIKTQYNVDSISRHKYDQSV